MYLKKMNKDRLSEALIDLSELVTRLRRPDGCPWDALQTDLTIRTYLLEEAYEVLDAIERGSPEDVCDELGDLLFQILFLADIAREKGEYDLIKIMDKITGKMIKRHPHVFGDTNVSGPSEVCYNWEKIKKEERNGLKSQALLLREVPANLPALLRAHRISSRASKAGFDWAGKEEIWDKVKEEFGELSKAVSEEDEKGIEEEIGDLLFSLVNLSRHWGLNAENLLRNANQKFIERFQGMEEDLKAAGVDLDEATPQEMDMAWEKIKADTR